MRKAIANIGAGLFLIGLLAGVAWLLYVGFFFVAEVIPYFWARGDYMPAVIAAFVASMLGGGILMSVFGDSAH